MQAIFTNLGDALIPIGSTKAQGFLDPLNPGEPYSVDGADFTVVTVGNNPSFKEELTEAFQNIRAVFERLIRFWQDHVRNSEAPDDMDLVVRVKIENKGPNDLRIILGNNANDAVLTAGNSGSYVSPEYIEVRELGV